MSTCCFLNGVSYKRELTVLAFVFVKPGFHIVITSRWVSLTVFGSHLSVWFVGNDYQSLAVFQGR